MCNYHLHMTSDNPVGKREQAPSFKIEAKRRLVDLDLTVVDLAKRLKLARNTVSIAINHESMFPAVKKRIWRALNP